MKKMIFLSLLTLTISIVMAQPTVRLNAYGSYVFDDGFDVYNDASSYYNGKIQGGFQWGAGIELLPHENYSVELLYQNKKSDVPTTFKFALTEPTRNETFDLTQHYILLAGNRLQKSNSGKIEGYGGLMAGVLISDVKAPSTGKSGSNTDFTWGGRVGMNYWATKKLGIKIQAQLLTSSKATGGDVYYSYWGPVYLDTYTILWQFGLGGGLTFRLGK